MVLMKLVEEFLERGKLLSPGIVEELKQMEEGELETLFDDEDLVIGEDSLKKLRVPKPDIVRFEEREGDEIHVSDFTEFYLNRFEFLKEEVKKRLDGEDISSINNLSSGTSSIIGMVRKVEDGEIIVEDKTGELKLKTDERFLEDEVVGVKGNVIKNKEAAMDPRKIIYPDVPLGKEVRTLEEDLVALFVSDINDDVKKFIEDRKPDYVFCASELDGETDRAVHISSEPGELSDVDPVRCRLGDIMVLVHNGRSVDKAEDKLDVDRKDAMVSLLKKRHLDPVEMHSLRDRYFLREVPDIVHVSGKEKVATNYKGVTLLSTTEDEAFTVNLRTREFKEVKP